MCCTPSRKKEIRRGGGAAPDAFDDFDAGALAIPGTSNVAESCSIDSVVSHSDTGGEPAPRASSTVNSCWCPRGSRDRCFDQTSTDVAPDDGDGGSGGGYSTSSSIIPTSGDHARAD